METAGCLFAMVPVNSTGTGSAWICNGPGGDPPGFVDLYEQRCLQGAGFLNAD